MGRFDALTKLDKKPVLPPQKQQTNSTPIQVNNPMPVPPYGSTPVPPKKRVMKQRQPFDIYQDQYDTLKQIAREEQDQGLPGSMSAMVREGIDMIITKKKKTPYPVK